MNRGLVSKAIREVWLTTLACALALFLSMLLFAYILPTFQSQMLPAIMQIGFVREIIRAMLGTEISNNMGPELFQSVAWTHPVVLTIVVAHAIATRTRLPAGEVDRGTVDVLLGLPISRWQLHVSETIVWVLSGVVVVTAALVGNAAGSLNVEAKLRPDGMHRLQIVVNLLAFYLAMGAITWFLSALSDRRGRAVAAAVGVAVGAFLLNYLAQLWGPAKPFAFLSPLSYYRPVSIARGGAWPISDIAVLLAIAGVFWTVAGAITARRDLCTV